MTDAAQSNDSELAALAMERRFQLAEEIALIQGRHKAELEPLLEEQRLCETFVKDFMNTGNMQQYKVASGDQAFFQAKTSAGVVNFEETLDYIVNVPPLAGLEAAWDDIKRHIRTAGNWNILNKAVNKTAVQEYIEAQNAPPPGVKFDSFRDLQWRRGKAK